MTGLVFLDINSAAQAGSQADIVYNTTSTLHCVGVFTQLKQDGIEKEAEK